MDWKAFREMALSMTGKGCIPVYGDFCQELEEIVVECIHLAVEKGLKVVTLLINSKGGQVNSLVAIKGTMLQSGIEFTGFVTSRAFSSGFLLLQFCKERVAVRDAELYFHWGQYRLVNNEVAALMAGENWPIEHVVNTFRVAAEGVCKRTGVSMADLQNYALHERSFTAAEALDRNFIDGVADSAPGVVEETVGVVPGNV